MPPRGAPSPTCLSPPACGGAGLAFNRAIKAHLFAPVPVACAFVGGARVDSVGRARQRAARRDTRGLRRRDALDRALLVGCAQALALVPGTSRSGATIIGGMLFACA
jgi:undecaprenyl-diphosphatase